MAQIKRKGFGQVEPNHLSAQRTSQIYAQLKAHKKTDKLTDPTIEVLENGQYVKYDYLNDEVNFTGAGEWMMVFNEVKLYDDMWRESYKDFAMQKKNYTDEEMVPRVIKTNVGDIYTTNSIAISATDGYATIAVGDELSPNAEGLLALASPVESDIKPGDGTIVWQVVKITTMADGQDAVKVMRIK